MTDLVVDPHNVHGIAGATVRPLTDHELAHRAEKNARLRDAAAPSWEKLEEWLVHLAQGRTGSDLSRSLLNSNPEIHCEAETLGDRVLFPMAFTEGRCALSPKNVYGFKVKTYQLTQDQQIRDPKQSMSDLYEQRWKIVHLKRRNLLRQAISGFVLAHRKKPTHRITDGALRLGEIYVDCDELVSKIKEREFYMVEEKEVLDSLPHMPVTYEDDLLRAENHQDTLDRIFDYLGVPSAPVKTDLAKITPAQLSDFVQNHEEVIRVISKTEYAKFLAGQIGRWKKRRSMSMGRSLCSKS